MALTQTLAQIRESVRQYADVKGTTALLRHPDATVNDYINRALGSLHRKLDEAGVGMQFLSSSTVTTSAGTATYSLPADFRHLISLDLTANGVKTWLVGYEVHERAALTDPSATFAGVPFTYRLRGSVVELLPTPQGVYSGTLWYVPTPTQFATSGGDASTWDTIDRLDDYLVAYAAKLIATKDKKKDLFAAAKDTMQELDDEIRAIGRRRDMNSPARPVDEYMTNRWGRRTGIPRRWR